MVQNKVQPFFIYFKKMMKFYDLKARGVPQVLFVLLLAVSFGLVLLVRPLVLDYTIYVQQVYNAIWIFCRLKMLRILHYC